MTRIPGTALAAAALLALFLGFGATTAAQPPTQTAASTPVVVPGADVLLADPGILRGKRIGLVTHQAGLTADGRLTSEALARASGLQVTALFAPEHGIDGTLDAGEPVPTLPSRTPIYSLYGLVFQPTRASIGRVGW